MAGPFSQRGFTARSITGGLAYGTRGEEAAALRPQCGIEELPARAATPWAIVDGRAIVLTDRRGATTVHALSPIR
ncbi:hypothetical protein [Embleya sp. NPDC001921]